MFRTLVTFQMLSLLGCSVRNKSVKPPQEIILESIYASNLSEDRNILSTKNDEIMVSIIYGSKNDRNIQKRGYHLPTYIFDSTHLSMDSINVRLLTEMRNEEDQVWVCLIEIDEDNSENKTHQRIINLLNFYGESVLTQKETINSQLYTNDFLGYISLGKNQIFHGNSRNITGSDLLDEYAYKLQFSVID